MPEIQETPSAIVETNVQTKPVENDYSQISDEILKQFNIAPGDLILKEGQGKPQPSEDESLEIEESEEVKEEESFDEAETLDDPTDEIEEETLEENPFELKIDGETKTYSKEEVKALAQKGLDYTKKTMALAEKRKELEQEIKRAEADYKDKFESLKEANEEINLKRQWDLVLNHIKSENEDFFAEIQGYFQKVTSSMNNPIFKQHLDSMNSKIESIEKDYKERKYQEIRESFSRELESFQKREAQVIKGLGKVDWDTVKKAWVNGADTVEDAFYSIYGKQIAKGKLSGQKLETVRKTSEASKAKTVGSIQKSKGKIEPKIDLKKMSYGDLAQRLAFGKMM